MLNVNKRLPLQVRGKKLKWNAVLRLAQGELAEAGLCSASPALSTVALASIIRQAVPALAGKNADVTVLLFARRAGQVVQ